MREETKQERPLEAGRITQLKAQTKNPERVSVYIDGRFAFGVYQDVVLRFGLQQGRRLEVEEQQRIRSADQILVAKAKALHYLGYRDRSEQEIRRKLQRAGFDELVIEDVVARLRELGYVDDRRYALQYARRRFETGGYGPRRVERDLMRRGVPRPAVEDAIAEVFDDREDVLAAARAHAEKRWPRLAGEEDPVRRRKKLYDYLLRRGFSYDTIRQVSDELEARS